MKFDTTQVNFFNGCITIPIPKYLGSALQALIAAVSKGKVLQVQITIKRKQRSLDANAYLWALLGEMARVLYTDKDELYLQMLERYGVFTHIIVKPQAVEKVKAEWKAARELGPVTINGQTGIQLQCYFGSHTYDTREFSCLLNGVIDECKGLGIETRSDAELDSMLEEWGRKDG